jgi:hypothetical protein
MTLAIGWPHDPGENQRRSPATGPMTLAKTWPHDPGENAGRWPHEPGDRHFSDESSSIRRSSAENPSSGGTGSPSSTCSACWLLGTRSRTSGSGIHGSRRPISEPVWFTQAGGGARAGRALLDDQLVKVLLDACVWGGACEDLIAAGHRAFLFLRDFAAISFLIFIILAPLAVAFVRWPGPAPYLAFAAIQYLAVSLAARNAGVRLETNVLARKALDGASALSA